MAHQNVFRTREGGGAKPLVTLSPQTMIAKLIIVLVRYCTVLQIMLRGGLVATPRSRDFVVTYPV